MIDEKAIGEAVTSLISAIGEDPARDGLKDTPRRVAEMYKELFSGLHTDPRRELAVGFELGSKDCRF